MYGTGESFCRGNSINIHRSSCELFLYKGLLLLQHKEKSIITNIRTLRRYYAQILKLKNFKSLRNLIIHILYIGKKAK